MIGFLTLSSCNPEHNSEGKRLYEEKCLNCHQENGQGVGKLIPALTDQTYLIKNRYRLACIIENGMDTTIIINGIPYKEKMEGIEALSTVDLVNILNYIGQNWGNEMETFTPAEVSAQRAKCSPNPYK